MYIKRSIWHKQAAAFPKLFVIYIFLCKILKILQGWGEIRSFVRMFQDQFQSGLENEDFKKKKIF
jgi:hypothetical protein